jgi:subtilisin family serine protease
MNKKSGIINKSKRLFALLMTLALLFAAAPIISVFAVGGGGAVPPESPGFDGGDYVPDEVVALADSLEEAQNIAAAYGIELKSYSWGVAVFTTPQAVTESELKTMALAEDLPELSLNRIYMLFEDSQNETLQPEGAADFETFSLYNPAQWHHNEMYSEQAWDVTKGAGVVVAVIDTGVDTTHPAFAGRLSTLAYNAATETIGLSNVMDENGHGTHVSGIIAAGPYVGGNAYGVAPEATILPIKAGVNDFAMSAVGRGINYAVENGADIINISFGTGLNVGPEAFERQVIMDAVNSGVTVICASGNDKANYVAYPAAYPETIAVSATKQGFVFDSSYSNYGSAIDISAPGTNIYSTKRGGSFELRKGTSMASPNVAGVAALIKAAHPGYTPAQVRDTLIAAATKVPGMGGADRDNYYGYGVVNAHGSATLNYYTAIMYGDVNGDGRITAADVTMLLQYLAEWDLGDSINLANADVNGDGRITAADVTLLLQYLAEWDVVLGPKES